MARDVSAAPAPTSPDEAFLRAYDMIYRATHAAPWNRPRDASTAVHKIVAEGGISTKTYETIAGAPVTSHLPRVAEALSSEKSDILKLLRGVLGARPGRISMLSPQSRRAPTGNRRCCKDRA
jgi:hypothetical protein